MRTDAEVKEKLVDLLGIQLEKRAEMMALMDKVDKSVLTSSRVEHHSTRGMAAALFWMLGYDFKDIVEMFVDPSVALHNR
jgi:hypothetical protein